MWSYFGLLWFTHQHNNFYTVIFCLGGRGFLFSVGSKTHHQQTCVYITVALIFFTVCGKHFVQLLDKQVMGMRSWDTALEKQTKGRDAACCACEKAVFWLLYFYNVCVSSVCLLLVKGGMTQHTDLMTNCVNAEDREDSVLWCIVRAVFASVQQHHFNYELLRWWITHVSWCFGANALIIGWGTEEESETRDAKLNHTFIDLTITTCDLSHLQIHQHHTRKYSIFSHWAFFSLLIPKENLIYCQNL